MKKLNLAAITPLIGFPVKKGTWDFLQSSYTEVLSELIIGLIRERYGNYTYGGLYVLYGCEATNLGASTQFSDGAIFKNGEVYILPTQIVTNPAGANVFIVNLSVTQYSSGTEADPVTFTDLIPRNIHDIRAAVYSTGASGSGSISNYSSFKFPFKELIEYRTTFNGDTLDFTQTKTIQYDMSVSATGTPSVSLNLVNGIVGNKVRCIFAPSNSSAIVVSSITETGADILDTSQGLLPTLACSKCFVEYEFIGTTTEGSFVKRIITGFN